MQLSLHKLVDLAREATAASLPAMQPSRCWRLATPNHLVVPACRYLYTKKALSYTESVTNELFDQPIYIVQQLSNIVGWTTLIGLIVISCLLGVTMLVSLMRTYQSSARLPHTSCGEGQLGKAH